MTLEDIHPAEFPWFDYRRYTFSLGLRSGARAYLSGHSASEYDRDAGKIVVKGGMAEQARTAYAKVAAVLDGAGLGLPDAVRVVENVTLAGIEHYDEAVQIRRELFGDHEPVVVTVIVERLLREQAWLEVEVSAAPGGSGALGETDTSPFVRRRAREVAGIVYLPTILPLDESGALLGAGDPMAQYRVCLGRAEELLSGMGLGLETLVRAVQYLTPQSAPQAGELAAVRDELLGDPKPAVGSITSTRLHEPGVLVALDAVASRHAREPVDPGATSSNRASSPAVRSGPMLFCSTLSSLDAGTAGVAALEGDVAAQSDAIYSRLVELLGLAGLGREHLMKTIEYVTPAGLAAYRGVAGVRERFLTPPYPASTGAVCAAAGPPEVLLAIEATALVEP